jgi:hypothetical protein
MTKQALSASGSNSNSTGATQPTTSSSTNDLFDLKANIQSNLIEASSSRLIDDDSAIISSSSGSSSSKSAKLIENTSNNLYEDDLVQQLFLFELQQMEENDLDAGNMNAGNFCDLEDACDYETLINSSSAGSKNAQRVSKPSARFAKSNTSRPFNSLKQARLVKALTNECLENFIESLALCQSSALAMVISNSGYPIELGLDDIQTSGDGLFVLLKCIVQKEPLKLVDPLFSYLNKIKRLSEPLLWFFSSLFTHESVVKSFVQKGGIDVIAKGLQITTRQLLYSGPCIVSSLMNYIDTERQQMKALNIMDTDSNEGFTNFAPFGSIVCTSASGK